MRTVLVHGLAILAMLPVLFVAFILILAGGRLSSEAYGFVMIYMMFFGPVVLVATLIYYAIFRAHNLAILALVIASIGFFVGLQFQFVVDALGVWPLIFLAGSVSALTHHLVIRLLRRWTANAQPAA
jgi:hypothetical protein